MKTIPVEVSARHVHLSQIDFEKLFGKKKELHKIKDLSQTGEFASREKIIMTKKINGQQYSFRVLGPFRSESQIEISRTEAIKIGLEAELRLSGDLQNVKSFLEVKGPKGKVRIKTIVAKRHLHISDNDAKKLKIRKNQKISIRVKTDRGLVFENVIVRPGKTYNLSCHIDTDEANACGLNKICGLGELVLKK